ncbi:MAG: hypothetical protein CM15mP102_15540 [Flavobacteriales bacterium]|nr:MAG: hypothetical protein CM15mP102_15540 [Flavobacteriales bacterium]
MIFTQRILWGEKGLFRKTGISNLTVENREKELIVREKCLKHTDHRLHNFCWYDLSRYSRR